MPNSSVLQMSAAHPTAVSMLYSTSLIFVLATAVAYTYIKTFRGLSYSRNFVQSLILGSIVVNIAMKAIGNNVVTGLGMIGALTIIRFRSNLKEPKDMMFVFASLCIGIAAGVGDYTIATLGALGFCLIAGVLHASPFGQHNIFDGVLRFSLDSSQKDEPSLEKILQQHCRRFVLITLRESGQGQRIEFAYQIKLKSSISPNEFVSRVRSIETLSHVVFMMQEATVDL